jgi:hypothetical protein
MSIVVVIQRPAALVHEGLDEAPRHRRQVHCGQWWRATETPADCQQL